MQRKKHKDSNETGKINDQNDRDDYKREAETD